MPARRKSSCPFVSPYLLVIFFKVTILDVIQKTTAYLEKAGVPNPRLDVELLLAHVLHLKRMDLYLQFERQLTKQELDALRPLVKRRTSREPLQHILGTVDFCGLELSVTSQALIPRPETEILVQTAIAKIDKGSEVVILDIGTGCGAIGLALCNACPRLRCVATDFSEKVLALALENAVKTGLQSRVEFRRGDLFEPLKEGETFDLIISNPPYIPSSEMAVLQPEVQYDPPLALEGGLSGLGVIRRLIAEAPPFLKPGGWFLFEIGHHQADLVRQFLEENGWNEISFTHDLQGILRVAQARKRC